MDMRRLVGRNVARIRRDLGLTQEQLEERSGFSQQYLSGLERGRRNPTIVSVYEIAQALGVDYLDLLKPDMSGDVRSEGANSAAPISRSGRKR